MNFWRKLFGKKEDSITATKENEKIEPFKKRYQFFQELLASNNMVLEVMADMEEKLSGEFLFDRHYMNRNIATIANGVKNIIDNLNKITNNKYFALHERFNYVNSKIGNVLTRRGEIPVSSYTIFFDKITKEMTDKVGGKNSNLGEIRNQLHIPTPEGFGISTFAFRRFMEHNGFLEKINERLSVLSVDNIEVLDNASKEIQDLIIKAEIPPDLEKEIVDAYAKLCEHYGRTVWVAVRSSAIQEDGEFSFAGQHATFLNVPYNLILQRYKEVIASLFTPNAIFYYKAKGFHESDMVMAVGILGMVDARAGGVIYSKDPNNPQNDTLIINAVCGLGKGVVDGVVSPETYTLSKYPYLEITERKTSTQPTMLLCKPDGELEEVGLSHDMKGKPCLTDDQIKILAEYAVAVEHHYQCPQDIEWAIDTDERPYILQTRPLKVVAKEEIKPLPTRIGGYKILLDKGVIACKGVGFGKAYVIRTEEDLKDFPEGAVLISKHTYTKLVTVMNRASAMVTDVGGGAAHMASLAREFGVPAILGTEVATEVIKNGQEITVDAINCNVYEGRINELIEFSEKRKTPLKNTQLFKTLEKVLKCVVPLNLVDPEDEKFKPEFCETFHDITRFCHETGMQEMFKITETPFKELGKAVRLVAGIPLGTYLFDLGGGIEGHPKYLYPEHISSVPFRAFLNGLISMKWPEPPPVDLGGFMGMIAHTLTISEEEIYQTGENSFSFISGEYMNFSIRLGYHFSAVEAYAGENINDNFIRFFFKGGGAVLERRLRRIRLITEILKRLDFGTIKVFEDVIDAALMKYKQSDIEKRLKIMGRLTAYTKQQDMAMYNDSVADFYIEEFFKQHFSD